MTRELMRKGNQAISMNRKQKNIQKHEVKAFIRHEITGHFREQRSISRSTLEHRNLDEAFHVTKDLSPRSLSYYIAFYRDRRESITEWLKWETDMVIHQSFTPIFLRKSRRMDCFGRPWLRT